MTTQNTVVKLRVGDAVKGRTIIFLMGEGRGVRHSSGPWIFFSHLLGCA